MSLNDKASAALRRELAKCFPERPENDPGHARLADALSKPTHTPGPWEFNLDAHGRGRVRGDGCWVATTWTVADDDNYRRYPAEANARLIAAAPCLLSALKELASAADAMLGALNIREVENDKAKRGCRAIAAAYNAIARATGGAA